MVGMLSATFNKLKGNKLTFFHTEEIKKLSVAAVVSVFIDEILSFPVLRTANVFEVGSFTKFLLFQQVEEVFTPRELPVLPVHHQVVNLERLSNGMMQEYVAFLLVTNIYVGFYNLRI